MIVYRILFSSNEDSLSNSKSLKVLPRHNLIMATQKGLIKLEYDPKYKNYAVKEEDTLSGINSIVSCDKYIFCITRNRVVKFNDKLKKTFSKEFNNINSLATDSKNVFISADESFIALDKNLKELSRLELEGKKKADDIIIYKNNAYLLDNFAITLYLFRVNIANPKNMQIDQRIKFVEVNAHLEDQWLNPEFDQWMVTESFSRWGGQGKNVHIFSMKEGKMISKQQIFNNRISGRYDIVYDEGIVNVKVDLFEIKIILLKTEEMDLTVKVFADSNSIHKEDIRLDKGNTIYSLSEPQKKRIEIPTDTIEVFSNNKLIHKGVFNRREKGFIIKNITDFPPSWAVVQKVFTDDKLGIYYNKSRIYLAKVDSENNNISLTNFLDLNVEGGELSQKVNINRKGNYLFITFGGILKIIDIEQLPELIFSKEFKDQNIQDFIISE